MKLRILLISAFMLLSAGTAWADMEINETNFPDANFRNYLLNQSYGSDGKLTDEEIAGVTYISVSSMNIRSLKGIEYFTALTLLYCDSKQLTSLDLSKNTALTGLYCMNNQLTSLDLSKNTALTELWTSNNQLTSLDVSKNTALKYLSCGDNQLTSLDVSKNTALTSLVCDGNQLTSLDVSGCTALTRLECYNNQLTSLDVSKNTALTYLSCSNNQLTSLDLSKNTALTELSCYNNQLTSLDVSGNTALTRLDCYQNQIKGAAMDALVASLPTSNDCEMRVVSYMKEKNVISFPQVAAARAKGWILYYEDRFTGWKECPWEGIEISEENFPDANFRSYLLSQSYGSDEMLTNDEVAGVTVMNVESKNIQNLQGIEYFTALEKLWCSLNQLTSLDVSKNTALTRLNCEGNQLTSLDVSKNTKLTFLSCSLNPLTSLDVSKNTALTELYCDDNQLTSLDVSGNTALTELYCDNNPLTSLDVSGCTALTTLWCNNNQLTSLDVSGNTALTTLWCSYNQLTSLDVSKNTALTKLYCYSNRLTSLDVSKNTKLYYLYCYSNRLTSLDVSGCTALKRLECYQNQIKGAAMDALVASLPKEDPSQFYCQLYVIYNEDEQNEMTKVQVAVVKDKGWTPMKYDGTGWEELKIITPMPDLTPEELLKIDMISSDMSSWFVDKETKIQGSNVNVTRNTSYPEYAVGSIQTADGKTHPYSYFYMPSASTINPNVGFYLPYNLKGEYDIYLVTMPTWTYQNNFDEEKRRYRFRASIWEKDEQNNFPSTGTALTVDGNNTFETPEVDANVITDTTFIGTYDFRHAYTDDNTPGVILQINPNVLASQRRNFSNSIIFAGVVLVAKDVEPQTGIAINEENFPDANFRNYLLEQYYGSDGVLTDEEIAGVTEINVIYEGIQSLKGIEFFTALTELSCSSNQLTSLDVSLNTALTYLSCYNNQLTSLDVSKNTALTVLDCYSNQLTSLDVSKNTALTWLQCTNNQLTSLDVSGCTALKQLVCNINQLTTLDVSKNTALTRLGCYSNQLTSLDVSKNTMLKYLDCGANQLSSLDVSKNTALTELGCYFNQLTSLDVSNNTALTTLYCDGNQLTSLDVSKNAALTELGCPNNQLTSLDLSKNTALTSLECYQNHIKGAAMDALVASLPTVSNGSMRVIYYENEQNVMTTTQVAAAKAKGWIPYYTDNGYDWYEYAGVDPSTGVNNVEAADADDSAPWYTINGVELTEKPTIPGIYIHGGKKVVVK